MGIRSVKVRSSNFELLRIVAMIMIIAYHIIYHNGFYYSIWNTQDWVTLLFHNPIGFILKVVLWTLGVFLSGVLVHLLYQGTCMFCNRAKRLVLKNAD